MAPRKRSPKNRDMPDNLYEASGYYRYRHPQTGAYHGMGTDRAKAIVAANKLNHRLVQPTDLVANVLRQEAGSVSQLIDRYVDERQPHEGLAPSTLKLENYRLVALRRDLGHLPTVELSVRACADWLDGFKGNAYTKHRGTLVKVCKFGLAKGLLDGNPAEGTLTNPRTAEERKRLPLSKAQFDAIYAIAPDWMQVAMDLALISLQRRGDLVRARYDHIEGNVWQVIQSKTEKHGHRAFLKITMGEGLQEVIQRSRSIAPVCPFILHRVPERKKKAAALDHWAQITPDHLSKMFAQLRDCLPEFQAMSKEQRPGFHTIRGLGGHLYLKAGFSDEYVKQLYGHTTQEMSDEYTDQHVEWTDVRADL